MALNDLVAIARRRGDTARAEALYRRALAVKEALLGPEHADVAITLNDLGALCHALGLEYEAEGHLRRALAVLERAVEPTHPALLACLENYRDVLRAMGAAGAPCRTPNGGERDPGGAD